MRSDPDILIVGAGMGGSALAYALKDTGLRIHVLERGRIVESGRHADLLERKGLYYAMWRQQVGERRMARDVPRLAAVGE